MYDILCVTNRSLCKTDFIQRIEEIAKTHPLGLILREKDLSESEYTSLAKEVMSICKKYKVTCILHSFAEVATKLNSEALHLPLSLLRKLSTEQKERFKILGASCHSIEEAVEAEKLGCTYITAGHIFATDCKKNLPPRGTDFLRNICKNVSIPVFSIGGINSKNIDLVIKAGAKGVCIMSGVMCCEDVDTYITDLKAEENK